jgi:hypothetical protein
MVASRSRLSIAKPVDLDYGIRQITLLDFPSDREGEMRRPVKVVLALLPAVAAAVAAWPILGNYFYADDFTHLFELASFGPWEFLTAPNAGHMYLVRNAVFYASFRVFGMEPLGYFWTALVTHVANTLLLAILVRRVTGDALLACLAAVLFAVSPAQAGTLGWYSVYGHALATTATLSALVLVTPARLEDTALDARSALAAVMTMLVASQCFGTAAALAIVFPAMALLLRPATRRAPRSLAVLAALPVLVAATWLVMNAIPTRLNPWGAEAAKNMALLATDYRHVGMMAVHLAGLGVDALVLGPPVPLGDYGGTPSLIAIAGFVAAIGAALALAGRRRRAALLAFLLGAAVCYLAVAAGRAALYVAYAHEHLLHAFAAATRYQYLAQALLAVALALALDTLARLAPAHRTTARALLACWLVWAVIGAVLLPPTLEHPDALDRAAVLRARDRLEHAILAQPPGAVVCLPIEPVPVAIGFPGTAGVFVLFHPRADVEGRRVYFVSTDPRILALRDAGGRMRELIAADGTCPPGARSGGATRGRAHAPIASRAAAMMSSASRRMAASRSPSTITRSSGSVPEYRTSTRPRSPSSRSACWIAAATAGSVPTSGLLETRRFSRTCGKRRITRRSSESGRPVSTISASTASPVISPSPVVL